MTSGHSKHGASLSGWGRLLSAGATSDLTVFTRNNLRVEWLEGTYMVHPSRDGAGSFLPGSRLTSSCSSKATFGVEDNEPIRGKVEFHSGPRPRCREDDHESGRTGFTQILSQSLVNPFLVQSDGPSLYTSWLIAFGNFIVVYIHSAWDVFSFLLLLCLFGWTDAG